MENNKEIGILYFNTRDELIRVDLKTVGYFTDVYFINGYRVTLPINMASLEKMLNGQCVSAPFVRIGRSLIVGVSHIVHIHLPKQELVLCNMNSSCILKVNASKETLKKLKELYINK